MTESDNAGWMRAHWSSPRKVVQGWLVKLMAIKTRLPHKPEVSCTRLAHAPVCAAVYRLAEDTCMHASLRPPLIHPVSLHSSLQLFKDSPGTRNSPLSSEPVTALTCCASP